MKFSAFTLVSRNNLLMENAVKSVLRQKPDEYICYLDDAVLRESAGVVLFFLHHNQVETRYMELTDCEDHHDDVTRTVHRGILEAKHQWVLNCDDDDEVMSENVIEKMEPFIADDVGMIYGDKVRVWPEKTVEGDIHVSYVQSWDWVNMLKPGVICGSVILYNREAFKKVYRNIDVWNPREGYGEDYGYWWDYKIAYWLMRYGYRMLSCGSLVGHQNVNMDRGEKRLRLGRRGVWREIVKHRHRIPRSV